MPCISAIITTHNRINLLPRAVKSVLEQTYRDFELVIVDDASSDGTMDLLKGYKDKGVIKNLRIAQSKGANNARNEGVKVSGGEYIAFLDDDDFWYPKKLERQLQEFEMNRDVVLVGAWFRENGQVHRLPRKIPLRAILSGNSIGGFSKFMFRKQDMQAVGGLDLALRNSQDWDLWIRMAERGIISIVQECLVEYETVRTDRISSTKDVDQYYGNYLKVVKRNSSKMGFWTKQRHACIVGYHTTPRHRILSRLWLSFYYLIVLNIDKWLVKMSFSNKV